MEYKGVDNLKGFARFLNPVAEKEWGVVPNDNQMTYEEVQFVIDCIRLGVTSRVGILEAAGREIGRSPAHMFDLLECLAGSHPDNCWERVIMPDGRHYLLNGGSR